MRKAWGWGLMRRSAAWAMRSTGQLRMVGPRTFMAPLPSLGDAAASSSHARLPSRPSRWMGRSTGPWQPREQSARVTRRLQANGSGLGVLLSGSKTTPLVRPSRLVMPQCAKLRAP